MLGWVLPNFASGGYGVMGALGSAGLLGEEMEEAMEQMLESGLPPPQPSRPPCRRCAPLRCAVAVAREAARHRTLLGHATATDRQRYHQCQYRSLVSLSVSCLLYTSPSPRDDY